MFKEIFYSRFYESIVQGTFFNQCKLSSKRYSEFEFICAFALQNALQISFFFLDTLYALYGES